MTTSARMVSPAWTHTTLTQRAATFSRWTSVLTLFPSLFRTAADNGDRLQLAQDGKFVGGCTDLLYGFEIRVGLQLLDRPPAEVQAPGQP